MQNLIKPTIGRKVWFWASADFAPGFRPHDHKQAFDATIVFVQANDRVNLAVTTHDGNDCFCQHVDLREPREGDSHGGIEDYATWMPFQVGQAKAAEVAKVAAAQQQTKAPVAKIGGGS